MYLSSARLEEEGFLGGWITDRDGVDAAFGGAGWKYLRCWFVVSGRPTKGQLGQAKSAARSSSSLWHRIMWLLKVWKDRVKNQHRLQHSDSVRYFHLVKKKKSSNSNFHVKMMQHWIVQAVNTDQIFISRCSDEDQVTSSFSFQCNASFIFSGNTNDLTNLLQLRRLSNKITDANHNLKQVSTMIKHH